MKQEEQLAIAIKEKLYENLTRQFCIIDHCLVPYNKVTGSDGVYTCASKQGKMFNLHGEEIQLPQEKHTVVTEYGVPADITEEILMEIALDLGFELEWKKKA